MGRLKIDHDFTAVKKKRASFDGVIRTIQGRPDELSGRNGSLKKSEFGLQGASLPEFLRRSKTLVRKKSKPARSLGVIDF
jgi:hypothetical protein